LFKEPVDAESLGLTDYHAIVKNAMDFCFYIEILSYLLVCTISNNLNELKDYPLQDKYYI
jgi:hypothetical protein